MLNLKQLELLKYTLERAIQSNDGTGVWLPEEYSKDLRACLKMVKEQIIEEQNNGNAGTVQK